MKSSSIAFAFWAMAACSTPAPPVPEGTGIGDHTTGQDAGTANDLAIDSPSDFSFKAVDFAVVKHDFAVADTPDLAQPPADLATTPDLAQSGNQNGAYGCDSLSYCYGDCYLEADLFGLTTDEYIACLDDCDASASNHAIQLANTAIQCAVDYCTGTIGTATAKCSSPNDSSSACIKCQNDATAGLQSLDCSSTHAVSCNPAVCAQTVTDCHSDGP